MNAERLLREVERRLAGLSQADRGEVLDALREEIARERRRLDPSVTVEAERERRLEAETLREILEAINREARLEETIGEVLKQLSRIVLFDSCSLALVTHDAVFRIIAARGFPDPAKVLGVTFKDPLTESIRQSHWPMSLADVHDDDRFVKVEGTAPIRSWAGIPLLVEGDVIGILCLDRHRVEPFADEDLHRAKAVAFSAAAAIRKAQLLEQVRRYAVSMERVVNVDQAVFAGRPPEAVAQAILDGALLVGSYRGGLLVLDHPDGPRVAASHGDVFAGSVGRAAPDALVTRASLRLDPARVPSIGRALGVTLPEEGMYLVPFATPDTHMGTLALLDPDGETPDDRLMESYASRSATAFLHALRRS